MPNIWRHPDEETIDIYPGLTVHDGRCSGSITVGQSRLPLWAFCWPAIVHGWEEAESGWTPSDYGMDAESFAWFVSDLLEARGEFARLLCILADAERAERYRQNDRAWWEVARRRKAVAAQLRRCLEALET